jgi:dihydropteroate synthase
MHPEWHLPDRVLRCEPQLVMGIVNVTPDSFSDGGRYASVDTAVAHGINLVAQGADILDVGGESTRPGSLPVALDEELRRVLPVVEGLKRQTNVPLSVDTSKAEVARACLAAGAHIINDVTALQGDPQMAEVARDGRAAVILMHMQGTPATMQTAPHYDNVVAEIAVFFEQRLQAAANFGIPFDRIALDPGFGFGKKAAHNLQLLAHLETYQSFGRPICLGVSRKGILGRILNRPVEQRLAGSLAAVCFALARGAAQIVRVHDVAETRDAVKLFAALRHPNEVGGAAGGG